MPTADNPFPSSTEGAVPGGTPGSANGSGMGRGDADLLNRVVQGAHETIDRLAESAAPHVHRLQEGMHSAGGALHERADHMREVGDEWAESLRSTVREHPLAAVAAALAVGLLLARMTER